MLLTAIYVAMISISVSMNFDIFIRCDVGR